MKVVIVGGVAGGATAAARIRRLDEQAEIVVFERSGFVSYANCGLPYYRTPCRTVNISVASAIFATATW